MYVRATYTEIQERGGRTARRHHTGNKGKKGWDVWCLLAVYSASPWIKERKKTDNPREGWEDGTPPPHRDFRGEVWC